MTTQSQPLPTPAGSPFFHYENNTLHAEGVCLETLARELGTPLYVYSRAALKAAWQSYQNAIGSRDTLVCYGMKANSNLAVLNEFAKLGSGFDIVSGGELARVLKAGGQASKVVFSGVGKQDWEIEAALEAGIKCFNVESVAELERISEVATRLGKTAPVSLRVNPDVDAKTHPYISTGMKENKFGIEIGAAPAAYQKANTLPGIKIVGVDSHIGSQITDVSPYLDALDKTLDLLDMLGLQGIKVEHLDIGGGLGIRYTDEIPLDPKELLEPVYEKLAQRGYDHLQLVLEPGRSLVGNAGVLLTRVQYLKHAEARNFAIIDAAMTDLMRPALYEAYHGLLAVKPRTQTPETYDIVGPVCESADWLAKQRSIALEQDDILALESAGAYGFVMSSQYNTRPRAAEVMVDGKNFHIIRQREKLEDLFEGEQLLP